MITLAMSADVFNRQGLPQFDLPSLPGLRLVAARQSRGLASEQLEERLVRRRWFKDRNHSRRMRQIDSCLEAQTLTTLSYFSGV